MNRFLFFILLLLPALPSVLIAQSISGIKICIDPGHGGHNPANDRLVVPDPGVEFWESESNYQKALLLKPLFEAKGATVYLTRNTNDYPNDVGEPSLSARVAFANSVGADWFHSIHSNAFNANVNYTVLLVRESTTNAGQPESAEAYSISQIISPSIQSHLRTSNNYTRLDYTFLGFRLGVLNGLAMPGQLSEGSFHDVLPETRHLLNNEYRKMEAHAILKGFLQYFGAPQDATGIIAGIQIDAETGKPINATRVRLLPEDSVYNGDGFNNGFYLFDGVAAGQHTVQFETPGYDADAVIVTMSAGGLLFRDRSLSSNLPPKLLTSTPQNNASGVSLNPTIALSFSRTLDRVSTEANVYLLDASSARLGGAFGWTNADRTISFTPSTTLLYDTTYRMVIGGGVLDTSGSGFDGNADGTGGDSLVITFRTRPEDSSPPAFAAVYPPHNSVIASANHAINATFDEIVLSSTLLSSNFVLREIDAAVIPSSIQTWNANGKTGVNLHPSTPLVSGKSYRVTVTNLADQWGNSLGSQISWDFGIASQVNQFVVIDDFEISSSSALWKQPASDTFSVGFDTTNLLRATSPVAPGIPFNVNSFRLKYGWKTATPPWLVNVQTSANPRIVRWTSVNSRLHFYVHGDGSNTLFRFVVEDSAEAFQPGTAERAEAGAWIPIDWVGWRLVEWDFGEDSMGVWLGNGILEGQLRIYGIQLKYDPGVSAQSGIIYLDHLVLASNGTTSTPRHSEGIPTTAHLYQNYPNPFNPETIIEFNLPERSYVTIEILDLLGRRVRVLETRSYNRGGHIARWDGKNEEGIDVASGVYLSRLRAGGTIQTRKMVLVR